MAWTLVVDAPSSWPPTAVSPGYVPPLATPFLAEVEERAMQLLQRHLGPGAPQHLPRWTTVDEETTADLLLPEGSWSKMMNDDDSKGSASLIRRHLQEPVATATGTAAETAAMADGGTTTYSTSDLLTLHDDHRHRSSWDDVRDWDHYYMQQEYIAGYSNVSDYLTPYDPSLEGYPTPHDPSQDGYLTPHDPRQRRSVRHSTKERHRRDGYNQGGYHQQVRLNQTQNNENTSLHYS